MDTQHGKKPAIRDGVPREDGRPFERGVTPEKRSDRALRAAYGSVPEIVARVRERKRARRALEELVP